MPRGVDEVELIGLAVVRLIVQGHALGLDGDTPLPLELHGVQHLLSHLPLTQTAADLNEAIGNGRFSMIDMGDDRKVTDVAQICH